MCGRVVDAVVSRATTINFPQTISKSMAKIEFHRNERPTVGIELELGLVDAKTMALTSAFGLLYGRLIGEGKHEGIKDSLKPELMQCVLEINSCVSNTIADAERDLRHKLAIVESACD